MQPKTISIPFNRDNFLSDQKMIWRLTYAKIIKYDLLFTVVAVVIFITDIIIDQDQSITGLSIVGGYFFYIIMRWAGLLERFLRFMNRRKRIADRFSSQSFISTYIFSEQSLEYRDNEKIYQLNWSCFKPYTIKKDIILISSRDVDAVLFSFTKKEISDEDYQEIQLILGSKIGRKIEPGKNH